MSRLLIKNSIRIILLIALQVFVFKNIGYYNLAAPFPYVLILLLLPARISNFLLFLLAFALGLTIDAFYNTLGIHAAACVVLAWVRILFINITLQSDNYEGMETPSASETSFQWFSIYSFVLIFFHHICLYLLESFSLKHLLYTLLSALLSCIFTWVLVFLHEILFFKKKKKRL